METLFEHILFALSLGLLKVPRITWWGWDASDRSIVRHLESSGEFVVDVDILISSCSSHGCEPPIPGRTILWLHDWTGRDGMVIRD